MKLRKTRRDFERVPRLIPAVCTAGKFFKENIYILDKKNRIRIF